MTYKVLRAVEDDDFGSLGLKFVEPHRFCNGKYTIQTGLLLAHDIIEHQQGTKSIGSIGDEMLALGGTCYSRGQWGQLTKNYAHYSAADSLAHDLTGQMANLYLHQDVPFRQKLVRSRGEDPTGIVDMVIEAARENWSTTFESDFERCIYNDERDSYLEACRIYMLHGAKLAERRFRSGLLAHDMFWALEEKAERITNSLEYEGQQFRLFYDFKQNVRLEEYYPDDVY